MVCLEPEPLQDLGVTLRFYSVGLSRRLAVLLAAYVLRNLTSRGHVVCVYASEKMVDALEELAKSVGFDQSRVVYVKNLDACKGMVTVALYPPKVVDGLEYAMLVVAEGRGLSKLGLIRLRAEPLGQGVYRIVVASKPFIVEEREGRLCKPSEEPLVERAWRILEEAFNEYGPLPLRDAVQLVANGLGLSKMEARRLIYQLASMGRVRIEAGYVSRR